MGFEAVDVALEDFSHLIAAEVGGEGLEVGNVGFDILDGLEDVSLHI